MAETGGKSPPGRFIGQSAAMQGVYRIFENAAPTNATVFITGESGVGKELCAEVLHKLGKRKNVVRSVVVLNGGGVVTLDRLPRPISGIERPPPLTTAPPIKRLEPAVLARTTAVVRRLDDAIRSTIAARDGSVVLAAAALGVAPSTLTDGSAAGGQKP